MTEELTVEGKLYISSKRAAQLSQYTQDYVGQLCRGGHIDAQRIGGLWYVYMESLTKYKEKAESYVPQPPQQPAFNNKPADTLISFDGKDYISASRAAEITGYHQDYVGQLAREGKILSRQVGNRWYVEREDLLKHKEEKDRLLAAVQTEAVGIPVASAQILSKPPQYVEPLLTYSRDDGALIPSTKDAKEAPADVPQSSVEMIDESTEEETHNSHREETIVPIRIEQRLIRRPIEQPIKYAITSQKHTAKKVRQPRKAIFYKTILGALIGVAGVVLIGTYMLRGSNVEDTTNAQGRGSLAAMVTGIGDVFERFITTELIYRRPQL